MNNKDLQKLLEDISRRPDDKGPSRNEFNTLQVMVVSAMVVLVVLVVGLVMNAMAAKQATYQSLVDKVNDQNIKIDTLANELQRQKGFR